MLMGGYLFVSPVCICTPACSMPWQIPPLSLALTTSTQCLSVIFLQQNNRDRLQGMCFAGAYCRTFSKIQQQLKMRDGDDQLGRSQRCSHGLLVCTLTGALYNCDQMWQRPTSGPAQPHSLMHNCNLHSTGAPTFTGSSTRCKTDKRYKQQAGLQPLASACTARHAEQKALKYAERLAPTA